MLYDFLYAPAYGRDIIDVEIVRDGSWKPLNNEAGLFIKNKKLFCNL